MSFSGLKIECELTPFQNLKEQTVQLAIHIDHVDDGASYDLIDTAESKVTSEPPKVIFHFFPRLNYIEYIFGNIVLAGLSVGCYFMSTTGFNFNPGFFVLFDDVLDVP